MITIPDHARTRAETTLASDGTCTRPVHATFDPSTGTIVTPDPAPVWTGRCSVSPPTRGDRSDTIGDDRIIGALVCRIPAHPGTKATASGNPTLIRVGDTIAVDGIDYVVRVVGRRTSEVLRRLTVTEVTDAEQVPQ